VALGLLMAWILIPASAIFLSTYGSGLLPVTYVGAAGAGVGSSALLATAFRRRALATVALRVLAITSVGLAATWLLLISGASWVSFGLLVLVPIVVPVGFMLLVGQAGMLLDVRALKALYARVIAGFALGFVAGGLTAPPLLAALGRTEHIVLAAAAAGGLWAALLLLTRHQYPAELSAVEHDGPADRAAAPTRSELLRHPYVALIVAFQMLSAVESQWLDYLVYDRAAQRYEDSQELAGFVSRFTAIAYGADILFLLLVAGLLLRRLGLRYGLSANPGVILAVMGAVIAISSFQGGGATAVFVLIVAARVTDLTLADGASRTSLSAAYQVVPTHMRLAVQAGVEGLAVPLGIGLSGVVLLALRATVGTGGVVLPALVSLVVAVWLVVGALLHRSYRAGLLTSLRYRTLDLSILSIDDPGSIAVVDRLLDSDDVRDVRLGLDTLAMAEHPDLPARLERLTIDPRAIVRSDALARLVGVAPERAAAGARRSTDDPDPGVRATAVRVLASVGERSDLPAVEAHQGDADAEVAVAVLVAMAHLGGDDDRARVSAELARHGADADPGARTLAARALGAAEPGIGIDRGPLRALLLDRDHDVATAALTATRWPDDHALLAEVAHGLRARTTSGAAAAALVRAGTLALPVVDDGLAATGFDRRVQVLLVRVAREVGGWPAVAALTRHLGHPDREVGLAVLSALGALVSTLDRDDPDHDDVDTTVATLDDLEHATRVLNAIVACEAYPAAHRLRAALRDELDLVRRRVLAALAVHHGEEPIARASFQLANGDVRSHALAVEWLEVTITGPERAALALLEPGLTESARLRRLCRGFAAPDGSLAAVLHDLVTDSGQRWRQPWLRACALHAAWSIPEADVDLRQVVSRAPDVELDGQGASIVQETWAAIAARAGRASGAPRMVSTIARTSEDVS
jgi:HEAT repeat protein